MINSKPKTSTLFSLGAFILLCLTITGYQSTYLLSGSAQWYHYLFMIVFGIPGIILLLRVLISYKTILIKKESITIKYPFIMKKKYFKLKDIEAWCQTEISTNNTTFRHLEIKALKGSPIKISNKENTEYERIATYLRRKAGKKEAKESSGLDVR